MSATERARLSQLPVFFRTPQFETFAYEDYQEHGGPDAFQDLVPPEEERLPEAIPGALRLQQRRRVVRRAARAPAAPKKRSVIYRKSGLENWQIGAVALGAAITGGLVGYVANEFNIAKGIEKGTKAFAREVGR